MNTTQTQVRSTDEVLKLALEALENTYALRDDVIEAITAIKEALAQPEQEHEVLGFNGWGFPIEKPNKALIEKTADHDVDCLCIDCSMVDEQDDVPWTDKAFERLCENWNNMTSAEFAIVQRFLFGVYAHPPVPYVVEPRTAQPKEPEQEHVADREVLRLADAIELRVENKAERMVIADKLRKLAYTTPPQRTWVGLTDVERIELMESTHPKNRWTILELCEAKLRKLNESQQRNPQFKEFIKWVEDRGHDAAHTYNPNTGKWICLNSMTADLWKAWEAAHGIKE